MSDLTLGLDLGSNSLGWALIDDEGQRLVATGVRVFPEGVDRDKQGGELSKNETRRVARGMRRQIDRRARRKRQLREALVANGLLPSYPDEQAKLHLLDPYDLRRRALDERLNPHEIGRLFVHLNQHRGFQSNRRADRAARKETSDMLEEISALEKEIMDAGHSTLGQHLAHMVAKPGEVPLVRVRGRHTRRDMYQREFEAIWGEQRKHHPNLLTENLKQCLHQIIFFQRPMYWPASVIGHCELEPRLPRCPRADRRAQRFRLLQEVNNLRVLDPTDNQERRLTEEERKHLVALLSVAKELTFDNIRKKMEFLECVRFNLERGDRKKLDGSTTDALLGKKDLFGKAWKDFSEDDKNRLVTAMVDDKPEHLAKVGRRLGIADELTKRLREVALPDGYASYSLHAIKRLLPHLELGLPLTSRDGSPCALGAAGYILPWQQVPNQKQFLPKPPELTNPLVRHALHEVRKVINAILRELVYKQGQKLARIHIELAREVKGTFKQRQQRSRDMRDREARRDAAADKIREEGVAVSRDAIDRYLLWEEQQRVCIYSGRPISLVQLLRGEVVVDHILPYPRSLDNSFSNRVVCFYSENDAKRGRTPHEWLGELDPEKFQAVLQRADHLPDYHKARRFRQPTVSLDDFFARQFVDTTYITTQVSQYARCLGADVICTKGQHTAELRRHWGLHDVLRHDGLDLKNREDHRHHAIDAIVIALTGRSALQQLAGIRRRGGTERTGEVMPDPWNNFRDCVQDAVKKINVSHRVQRKVKGELHERTIYGPTPKPGEFVTRKPLEELKLAMVNDIRDEAIKRLVIDRLQEHGLKPDGDQPIPKEIWRKPLTMKSGVPVRKVRLIRRDKTIQAIRAGQAYVKPGSTHHLCIFELKGLRGKTKRDAVFVSMLDAMHRSQRGELIIQRVHPTRPDARFLMSLSRGEMVLGSFKGRKILARFSTSKSTEGKVLFVAHTDARPSKDMEPLRASANTLVARKVTVDPIGRIRWAND